jgi:tripartite-type tricarboxylate transporter receptor subunit TctC
MQPVVARIAVVTKFELRRAGRAAPPQQEVQMTRLRQYSKSEPTRRMQIPSHLVLVLAAALCQTAGAQAYPSHPLHMVIGFPAGGPVDIVGRIVAAKLTDVVGQQVVVDNRAGANAIIGTEFVAKSPPDGYTMVLASPGSVTISPAVYPKMPYDTLRDLAPVTLVTTTPEVLVLHPSVPAKSIKELVALARARRGQLNIASTGSGSLPHMALELLNYAAKIDMVHVPYNGAAPAVAATAGGQVHGMFADLPVLLPYVRSGKLRALALADERRAALLPDLATLAEGGYPGVIAVNWYGILVPARTAPDIITRLHDDIARALNDPLTHEKLLSAGAAPVGNTPAQFNDYLKADLARWAGLAQTVSIKID